MQGKKKNFPEKKTKWKKKKKKITTLKQEMVLEGT